VVDYRGRNALDCTCSSRTQSIQRQNNIEMTSLLIIVANMKEHENVQKWSNLDTVEESRLPGPILVRPCIAGP
jgi:hypothetical protein